MYYKHICIALLIFLLSTNNCLSQVVMGSKNEPLSGAILEIKNKNSTLANGELVSDTKNITSTKGGIILPRVQLKHIKSLEPFIAANDPKLAEEKLKHAGMIVYNINESYLTASDPMTVFKQGLYVWDGERWSKMTREEHKFFHMPSFNLDTSTAGTFTVDLYALYAAHFARQGALASQYTNPIITNPTAKTPTVPIFRQNELDYYITTYDDSIIEVVSVDNSGKMTYKVDPKPPFNPFSFINIVLVVK